MICRDLKKKIVIGRNLGTLKSKNLDKIFFKFVTEIGKQSTKISPYKGRQILSGTPAPESLGAALGTRTVLIF